ncbi:mucoidy inhibitor MuiA family protein [Roseovarius spongiae]|uniref:Mucoidy inhibitor MuiA family protein n=1 Tax=Roseovarius spongiae TaxID=2320272 RepID=A0A3A8AZC4_9RHOB|nr:DUF4139 domain-containing protein [Roseovarius spongiae]RKF16310.1 mucoidy inhibitor MuiA family protein [Roseovarius spongiae]
MRALSLALAILPTALFAEDIPLGSDVSAVTLYPQGATITREAPFAAPAGRHALILTDLPLGTPLSSVRVAVDGAEMGGVTARNRFVPPRGDTDSAAIKAAEEEVERLEEEMRNRQAEVQDIRLEAGAAKARVAFLEQIGKGEGVAGLDISALRDLVGLIGRETLSAERDAHDALRRADAAERALRDLSEELKAARQALAALVPEPEERAMLSVAIAGDKAMEGMMTITYMVPGASWRPVYDLRLDRASGALAIERGAFVAQSTGENWEDVALRLSTVRPSEQTTPSDLPPERRWVMEKPKDGPVPLASAAPAPMVMAEEAQDMAAGAAFKRVTAEAEFDGLAVTYTYPEPVSIASGADYMRLTLDTLETGADVFAEAVPLLDETAFLMAKFTNDMGELILPSAEANFYLDGAYQGQRGIALIAAGAEETLSFGPIEGLRLTRTVLVREQGASGVISKSNDLSEEVRIEVENLTKETWPVRLLDRVAYSEQEKLTITWSADPEPTETDIDGKRGVLAWEFDLPAGETQKIGLKSDLEWPEGMILR